MSDLGKKGKKSPVCGLEWRLIGFRKKTQLLTKASKFK